MCAGGDEQTEHLRQACGPFPEPLDDGAGRGPDAHRGECLDGPAGPSRPREEGDVPPGRAADATVCAAAP